MDEMCVIHFFINVKFLFKVVLVSNKIDYIVNELNEIISNRLILLPYNTISIPIHNQ